MLFVSWSLQYRDSQCKNIHTCIDSVFCFISSSRGALITRLLAGKLLSVAKKLWKQVQPYCNWKIDVLSIPPSFSLLTNNKSFFLPAYLIWSSKNLGHYSCVLSQKILIISFCYNSLAAKFRYFCKLPKFFNNNDKQASTEPEKVLHSSTFVLKRWYFNEICI